MVRTHFHCRGPGSIPGQGTKITQAAWLGQKKKKKGNLCIFRESGIQCGRSFRNGKEWGPERR